jgi:hypothetical protein
VPFWPGLLVYPRLQDSNTPTKSYSYLDSGKLILANPPGATQTQMLGKRDSLLVKPTSEDWPAACCAWPATPACARS